MIKQGKFKLYNFLHDNYKRNEVSRGPFNLHGLTLIPASISNYIHYKVWDEITYPFQTSTVQPLKFRNG